MIQKMFSSQNRDFEENFPRSRGFSDFPWIFLCFCRPALVQQAVNDRLDQLDSPRRRGHGRHHTACHLVSPNWCIQNSTLVIYIYINNITLYIYIYLIICHGYKLLYMANTGYYLS